MKCGFVDEVCKNERLILLTRLQVSRKVRILGCLVSQFLVAELQFTLQVKVVFFELFALQLKPL